MAAREALQFIRHRRSTLEAYQSRVAHLGALAAAGRTKRPEIEAQARRLCQEIDNERRALRTELQNMPVGVRKAGAIRDYLRGLDSALQRSKAVLTPEGLRPPI